MCGACAVTALEGRIWGDAGVEHGSPEDAQHEVPVPYLYVLVRARGIQNTAMKKHVKGWH